MTPKLIVFTAVYIGKRDFFLIIKNPENPPNKPDELLFFLK